MTLIDDTEYQKHMAEVIADGFILDPAGYERVTQWTHILMNLVSARTNFQWVRDHNAELGDLGGFLQQHAFFIAGIMAYCRSYADSGASIPKLDAKQVYKGSNDGISVHRRLINLRNTIAAHTDKSDTVRLTLAVKETPDKIVIRHLTTSAVPTNEISDFLEAVAHTEHYAILALNKQLDHLSAKLGKTIGLD